MVALRRPVVATVAALALALPAAVPAAATGHADENLHGHDERPRLDELNETLRQYAEEQLDEHSHVVDGATAALRRLEADLAAAIEAAETARAEADALHAEAAVADRAVEGVRRELRRTTRELNALSGRIAEIRAQLGDVARAAYRSGGAMVGWSVMRDTEAPAGLSDSYTGARSVLRAGDGALRELAEAHAELETARDRLRGLRVERQRLVTEADEARARSEVAEEAANEAAGQLEEAQAAHDEALAAAETARQEEQARYDEFMAESEALEEWLAEYGLNETIEGTGTFVRPGTGRVTSAFGPRLHPILGYVRMHTGIDLGIGDGFIYAADHGVVVEAKWNGGYGYMVVVDHGVIDGRQVSTLYAHQPGLSVDVGMPVAKGQPIGSVGSTGLSTGPHLHFEVRVGGAPVDPWPWIRSAPMPEPME